MDWFHFLAYVSITAITPGPNTIASMSNASRVGFGKALPFNFGIWAAFSLVSLVCAVFCTLLSALIPVIQTPLLVVGGLYMLYLAWHMWTSTGITQNATGKNSFLSGALLQFVNPKIYVYCLVSMQAYILPHYGQSLWIVAGFALFLAFAGFVCTLIWAAAGSMLKVLFSQYATITNRLLALALVYCAVALFL